MLLRFRASNHLSVRDGQELSLIASSLKDLEASLIDCALVPNGRVLPAAIIYGANASGKSNFVSALQFMRLAVVRSHSEGRVDGGVPRSHFALDPACVEAPSLFDADFIIDGERYHYGFQTTSKEFLSEWLYIFPRNRKKMLFERTRKEFNFGRSLKGRNKVISDLVRKNSLFLSAAAQNDHEQLSRVAAFFRSIRFHTAISIAGETALVHLPHEDIDRRVIDFLGRAGTGVVDFRYRKVERPEKVVSMMKDVFSVIEKGSGVSLEVDETYDEIELAHQGRGSDAVYFDLERESSGTRRLLVLLSKMFPTLDTGTVMVVDELDASLHTKACESLLALFCSNSFNPRGAQLIATTHDTNLLRSSLLRRDQVWFTELNDVNATELYPLTDIRTRKGDNIEKGYLQGRYGAVPFAGPVSNFLRSE